MNLKKSVFFFGLAIVMTAATGKIVFAEEAAVAPVDPAVITSNQEVSSQKESDMQWAWGEVTNLDDQAKTVTLKYLDYETDQEKELVLVVDEKTTFENINDFNGLKLKDTLSVDYMTGADNKNIAKNISFEKPNVAVAPVTPPSTTGQPAVDATGATVSPETAAPDLAQPIAQPAIPADSSISANKAASPAPVATESALPVVQDKTQ